MRTLIISGIVVLFTVCTINAQQASQRAETLSATSRNEVTAQRESGPPQPVDIAVDDGRPLASAASQLQFKLGVPISYEDVRWVYRGDLVPVGELRDPSVLKLKNPALLVPSFGSLRLRFNIDSGNRNPLTPVESILEEALSQHVLRDNSGQFKFLTLSENGGYSIVPGRAKNIQGTLAAAESPLDARITLPEQERTGEETLDAILNAIAASSGAKIVVFSTLPMEPVRLGAKNEIAREVLNRLLRESYDWKASWHLYYGPSEGYWGLNLQAVYVETGNLTAEGKPEIRPVRWPGRPYVRAKN